MTEYNQGDLVEAVKGDRVLRARFGGDDNGLAGLGFQPWELELLGFTVTVIEKAAPALPTEPGWYTDKAGQLWSLRINGHGEPEWFLSGVYYPPTSVTSAAPLTRLEPVADTAKKVLDAVIADVHPGAMGTNAFEHMKAAVNHVGKQFGATS